jgi:hypothetical protein
MFALEAINANNYAALIDQASVGFSQAFIISLSSLS